MKRIYIMRHGKAEWGEENIEDFDRPLKKRGHKASKFMGSLLAVNQEVPDIILSSSAVRAQETTQGFVKALGHIVPVVYDETLYMTSVEHTMNMLRDLNDEDESVMIIGHNPTWENLIEHLVAPEGFHIYLPTCGVVCVDADVEEWSELGPQTASLKWFLIPKLFMKKHI